MKRLAFVVLAVAVGLTATAQVWKFGMGSSMFGGYPTLDTWLQADILYGGLGLRLTGTLIEAGTPTQTAFSLLFLGTPSIGPVTLTVGVGPGGLVSIGSGAAVGIFAVDAIMGVHAPLAPAVGVWMQVRFLGLVSGGAFSGVLMPGVGLYTRF